MKKTYETPNVEKIEFQYRDQVVAASSCTGVWKNVGDDRCVSGTPEWVEALN